MIDTSIVAIISSPRKGGNTDTIVSAMADAAAANGKDVKKYYLNPLTNKKGCQGCNACKKTGKCVTKDDLTPILEDIKAADGIIVSSPVYFGEACGQYRLLEDRYFGFLDGSFKPSFVPGKKVAVVTSCGTAGADELVQKMTNVFVNFFGAESVGTIAFKGGNPPDAAKNDKKIMAMAEEIGKKF